MNYLRDGTIKPRLIQSDGVRRDATGAAGLGRTVGDRTVSTFSALPTSAPKRPKIPTLAVGYGKAFPYGFLLRNATILAAKVGLKFNPCISPSSRFEIEDPVQGFEEPSRCTVLGSLQRFHYSWLLRDEEQDSTN
ncbi:hypothetical protein I7I51_04359 [Histoplasma capsulatum]|uniref:Uncharacterized protein n=1 Tax=Ajellomyces capsulatus TaxID=5037 RepID=A0A8A1MCF0_AJECA|nr:hypothetical protein I7I51_04359 [Histoplasma capsulatum]